MIIKISEELETDIKLYCKLNNIIDVDEYVNKILKQGHIIEKYGSSPVIKEKVIESSVNPINTELSKDLNEYVALNEKLKTELTDALNLSEKLNKELETEKNKNKKDLYGEI